MSKERQIKHSQSVKKAIDRVSDCGSQEVAVLIWCEDDVLARAKDNDIKLTRKQAVEIIREIDRRHDASMGINWDTLDYYIGKLVSQEKP